MTDLPKEPRSSEITPESLYRTRREFLKNAVLAAGTATGVGSLLVALSGGERGEAKDPGPDVVAPEFTYSSMLVPPTMEHVTFYSTSLSRLLGDGKPI